MNFIKMNELINSNKTDNKKKDYWFLCVDKITWSCYDKRMSTN